LLGAQAVSAQSTLAELQSEAEEALVGGEPGRAAKLANEILVQSPDTYAPLFILAVAQADLGDHDAAAQTAARAYAVAPDAASRVQSARVVAIARFRLDQFIRSEFWLRRAANDSTTNAEAAAIVRDYVRTVNANPMSFNFIAYVAPSDNINDGSADGITVYDGTEVFFGDAFTDDNPANRALSGLEFAASVRASYRLSRTEDHTTAILGYLSGKTYRLSEEARDILDSAESAEIRSLDGSDFATLQAETGIRHGRSALLPFGPTTFELKYGTYWQGDDRLVNFRDTIVSQSFRAESGEFGLRLSYRDQTSLQETLVDETSFDAIASYATRASGGDTYLFSFGYRYGDAGPQNRFDEYRLGVNYRRSSAIWGARVGGAFNVGVRTYDEYPTTIDGRDDRFASLQADIVFTEYNYFGFAPSVSLRGDRNFSTAEEETSSSVSILFGIESTF